MANNYLQPVNDHFNFNDDKLEDVDDDIFLSNSRTNSSSNMGRNTSSYEDEKQMYMERRRQIENRSLESTQKSLGLLYETEDVGKATAEELAKQREQLERTSRNLDEINASLRFSQRHLNGLKSVFGSLKNYLSGTGNRDSQMPSQAGSTSSRMSATSPTQSQMSQETVIPSGTNYGFPSSSSRNAMSPTQQYDNHPLSRLRDDSSPYQNGINQQNQLQKSKNPFESQLEANLEEMCGSLSRLKFLATDLGTEIQSQNELVDDITYKVGGVDLTLNKQNKEINKMLGKK